MAERLTKVAIVDVYQYGKVIFTGNSYEVKEHFEFTQKQFNRIRAMGEAVLKGTKHREKTMYAIKIGEEMAVGTFKTQREIKGLPKGKKETKEEQRLRRRIMRDMARERFYKS